MALQKVFIIRHAQSSEDVDPTIHNLSPDDEISLTELGRQQTLEIVPIMAPIIKQRDLVVCLSPSKRVIETYEILLNKASGNDHKIIIEKRIRNLNWGSVTPQNRTQIEAERYKAGVLRYKFPGGDDSILYVRGIYSSMSELTTGYGLPNFPEYILIITHGFALRVIAKALTGMSDEDFRWLSNPPNCFIAEVEAVDGKFILRTKLSIYKHG